MAQPVDERHPRADRAHGLTAVANVGLAAGKLGVGFFAGSPVLVADGWHSCSDVAMNLLAWGGARFARKEADEDHHYGHGNAEAVAALLVGLVVLAAGAGIVAQVAGQGSAASTDGARGAWALAMGIAAGGVKLALALHTARVASEVNSPSLLAVSRDNRADALTGLIVPVAIGASLAGVSWVEPAAAVAIGLVIGWMGIQSVREGFDVLMDRVADPELRGHLASAARGVEGVLGVQSVRVHPLGTEQRVDMEISVEGSLSVEQGHAIAHAVQARLVEQFAHVREVHVHVNPHGPA